MTDDAPPPERYDWKGAYQRDLDNTCQTHRTRKPCIFCADRDSEDAATVAISRYRNDPEFHARVVEFAQLIRHSALLGAELDWAITLAKQIVERGRG